MTIHISRIAALLVFVALLAGASLPADAEPPGGVPPGQAKKMRRGGHDGPAFPGPDGGGLRSRGDGPGLRGESPRHGPPDHAPAYGYRAKHEYRYYPHYNVYYDPARTLFFYERDGRWISAPEPPPMLELDLGGGVSLELNTAMPYQYNTQHRRQYP